MKKLQETLSRVQGRMEDVMVLQTLVRGSALFCENMEQFQARWEQGNYTEEEQRHVARLTKAYVGLCQALDGNGEDPMLWLGVLALGKFTRAKDVFLKPPGGEKG